jgi:hypothetical protein
MTEERARELWEQVVSDIRNQEAQFQSWKILRRSSDINEDFREYCRTLLSGLSNGVYDFAAYNPDPESMVLVPRRKIDGVDFIFVYHNGEKYTYFGIVKDGGEIREISKLEVKDAFLNALSKL